MSSKSSTATHARRTSSGFVPQYARSIELLVSCNKQLLELQKESFDTLTAEFSLSQTEFLNALNAFTAAAQILPRLDRYQAHMQRTVAAMSRWLRLSTQFQTALISGFGPPFADYDSDASRDMNAVSGRRSKSVVIAFPDRRAA